MRKPIVDIEQLTAAVIGTQTHLQQEAIFLKFSEALSYEEIQKSCKSIQAVYTNSSIVRWNAYESNPATSPCLCCYTCCNAVKKFF
ncbi:hypothetical protein ABIE50_005117 [Chitinophaga sp. OAE865]